LFRTWAALALFAMIQDVRAASTPEIDARTNAYFAIWANDATVTPQAVEKFYATRVDYYGQSLSREEVYRNKLYLIGLWPHRTYRVEPGSVLTSCDAGKSRCQITAVLDYQSVNPARLIGTQGATTVSLSLVRQDGLLKIERESGVPLKRSTCTLRAPDWTQLSNWHCSAYQFPPLPSS
jgi:hypothetical protein